MSAAEMDATIRRALPALAGELQLTMASVPGWAAAEGASGVRPGDLQRALCNALQTQLGAVACIEGPLPDGVKECWAGWLGRVDVLAKPPESPDTYFETQLCGVEKLYESLWDALKLGLFTALHESIGGYLVYAAPETGWARAGQHPDAIFEDGTIGVAELLHARYPDLWAACLRGTRTTRPVSLPFELRTERIADAVIRAPAVDWEVRCVRIQGDPSYGWTTFDGDGWPVLAEAGAAAQPAETTEAASQS
jgi:hypothetical protein